MWPPFHEASHRDAEFLRAPRGERVELDVFAKLLGNTIDGEDRLPRARRLARSAGDAFLGVHEELVRQLAVTAFVFVDAVDRADLHASSIHAVLAKSGNCIRFR